MVDFGTFAPTSQMTSQVKGLHRMSEKRKYICNILRGVGNIEHKVKNQLRPAHRSKVDRKKTKKTEIWKGIKMWPHTIHLFASMVCIEYSQNNRPCVHSGSPIWRSHVCCAIYEWLHSPLCGIFLLQTCPPKLGPYGLTSKKPLQYVCVKAP
jgi:hypothetical protein